MIGADGMKIAIALAILSLLAFLGVVILTVILSVMH
jgi:hypothetical protein